MYLVKDNKCLERTGRIFRCSKLLEFNADVGHIEFDITNDIAHEIGENFDNTKLEVVGISVDGYRAGTRQLFDITDYEYISVFCNEKGSTYLGVDSRLFVGMGAHNINVTFCYLE